MSALESGSRLVPREKAGVYNPRARRRLPSSSTSIREVALTVMSTVAAATGASETRWKSKSCRCSLALEGPRGTVRGAVNQVVTAHYTRRTALDKPHLILAQRDVGRVMSTVSFHLLISPPLSKNSTRQCQKSTMAGRFLVFKDAKCGQ